MFYRSVVWTALVTLVAGLLCAAVVALVAGTGGLPAVVVATLLSLPVGVVVLLVFSRLGVSAEAIVVGSVLRVGLTLGAAGAVAGLFGDFRSPVFFLSVAVVYLANLAAETWLVYREDQGDGRVASTS